MSDGFLSQEEIDALLRGEPVAASPSPAGQELSDIEKDALGEIGNISMGTAATTLSVLLGRRVSITTPKVSISTLDEIKRQYPLPYLVIEVGYTQGLLGTNILAIREQDALIIADLMMGGDGSNPPTELNELYMSAVSESMNQMMGSTATSISTIFKKKVDIAPPKVNLLDFAIDPDITQIVTGNDPLVRVSFRMEVEELIDSELMQLMPLSVAKEMVENLMNAVQPAAAPPPHPAPPKPAAPPPQPAPAYAQPTQQPVQNVAVQPVQFAPLKPGGMPGVDTNIGLLLDVPLQITVELGRTRKLIRDILELAPGSVIELDKLAGEPVDILANGKLIAKGEVVVIDENFGVRITDVISPLERVNNLQ
ncbi:flagellar motor switch phosphatase FliY [Sporomusa sphaeroides DSM 2875]|uniref:flagellar motor switch phosphatase FliY n=1 Tax=Sporomusa sphaeroides TaxID=47679 RepID=UPI002030749D|nr:flagellar motor switch phosphatase FliY [Sporomusa sphaeroides]MCM0760184.1 flagellar motor switch phosphatase FliY [Sporomusa sphaeroides DSM 2875]